MRSPSPAVIEPPAPRTARLARVGDPSRLVAGLVGLALLLAGCSSSSAPSPSTPPNNLPPADSVVRALAAGLERGELDKVSLAVDAAAAQADLATIMSGMDGLLPSVTPAGISYDAADDSATATLDQSYTLGSGSFSFQSTASLTHSGSDWQVVWSPTIVHPDLTGSTRLRHTRDLPKRAPILGRNKVALMQQGLVFDIGVDKHIVKPDQALTSAAAVAKLMKVDQAGFVKRVKAAGTDAFVVAVTVRPADVPSAIEKIPGARALPGSATLAPSRDFAPALLGSMGAPTKEQVAASHGDIEAGDSVGVSGLEKRYDARLRGTPGHTIAIVARTPGSEWSPTSPSASPWASPSPSETAGGSAAAGSSPSGTPSPAGAREVYSTPAVAGRALTITLDRGLQSKAEKVLSGVKGVASMVVLDRSTGGVLAAANSPASGGNPDATYGRYAPGSTFKVATSLALLRHGLTPTSKVDCPREVTINGKKFTNYSDYPASGYGTITLTQAVAYSCNTAFIKLSSRLAPGDLPAAAASLGVGVDYDAGFSSFFGSVPPAKDPVVKAADVIGQGDVLASPMAMAGLSASVRREADGPADPGRGHVTGAEGQAAVGVGGRPPADADARGRVERHRRVAQRPGDRRQDRYRRVPQRQADQDPRLDDHLERQVRHRGDGVRRQERFGYGRPPDQAVPVLTPSAQPGRALRGTARRDYCERMPSTALLAAIPNQLIKIAAIVVGALVLRWIIALFLHRALRISLAQGRLPGWSERPAAARYEQRARTITSLLGSIASTVIIIVTVLTLMGVVGLPLTPLLASAGVGGLAIGFGAQSLVKDFISGMFLIVEDQFGVGDKVTVGTVSGTVDEVTLRVTRIRDADGIAWYVRNGDITLVGNRSQAPAVVTAAPEPTDQ